MFLYYFYFSNSKMVDFAKLHLKLWIVFIEWLLMEFRWLKTTNIQLIGSIPNTRKGEVLQLKCYFGATIAFSWCTKDFGFDLCSEQKQLHYCHDLDKRPRVAFYSREREGRTKEGECDGTWVDVLLLCFRRSHYSIQVLPLCSLRNVYTW